MFRAIGVLETTARRTAEESGGVIPMLAGSRDDEYLGAVFFRPHEDHERLMCLMDAAMFFRVQGADHLYFCAFAVLDGEQEAILCYVADASGCVVRVTRRTADGWEEVEEEEPVGQTSSTMATFAGWPLIGDADEVRRSLESQGFIIPGGGPHG